MVDQQIHPFQIPAAWCTCHGRFSKMTTTGLPRVSVSGMLILGTFLAIVTNLFRSSIYCALLFDRHCGGEEELQLPVAGIIALSSWSRSFATACRCLFHASICAASFLNVLSHSAVALGALNDTYVLSILVGVGFDVFTRILQLVWWIWMTRTLPETTSTRLMLSVPKICSFEESTLVIDNPVPDNTNSTQALLLVMVFFYVYHMIVHVRALCMNQSLSRLQSVLKSALNNLKGIPGEGYSDHFFAYTDLGTHLLAFGLSALLLEKEGALMGAMGLLVVLAGISGVVLSRIPFREMIMDSSITSKTSATHLASMIEVVLDNKYPVDRETNQKTIMCSCKACNKRKERLQQRDENYNQHPVSFTIHRDDGICHLWLSTFEQLSGIISSATKP